MATTDIRIFDADNHLYETEEAFTKFLPDRYRGAIEYVQVRGRTKIAVRGQISEYIPNPTFEVVAPPGAQEEYQRNGNPEGKSRREIFGQPVRCMDAWRRPEPRLELMDEQGVDKTLCFPTLASLLEERLRDDPLLTHAVIHSLNEWIYETWQFNYRDRIFTTPVITLPIVEKAIEELEWVLERGARAVLIRPAPVPGYQGSRSFGLPEFDPFWDRVEDAGILVGMHSSDSGYSRYSSDWMGGNVEMLPFQPNTFRLLQAWRPVEDAVSALVCHGALTRHPRLKVAIIENGMTWLAPLMIEMGKLWKKMPQDFPENPVEALKRNIYISPFWEEDLGALSELLGEDHVLFGSDYPHPEGLAQPAAYLQDLAHLPEAQQRKIMGGNLARLMEAPATSVPTPQTT
jgi:predicted TIM-barrel fold metal-dependent hydrolase